MTRRLLVLRTAQLFIMIAGLLALCSIPAMAGTITVCPSGCNYTSIQEAIDHAVDGDTTKGYSLHDGEIPLTAPAVIDSPGHYRLINDLVNSTVDTAIRITASDVYLNGDSHTLGGVLELETSGVLIENDPMGLENITITNLTVTGWEWGFGITRVTNITLLNIQSTGNGDGIAIEESTGIMILDCIITNNIALEEQGVYFGGNGITLGDSSGIRILTSNISHNGWGEELPVVGGNGITSVNTTGQTISGCTINNNVYTGISCVETKDIVVIANKIHDNGGGGISIADPDETAVINGTIAENDISGGGIGIGFERHEYLVENNTVENCGYGILLSLSQNATLTGNTMLKNDRNFAVDGTVKEDYYHQVDTSNTVDGRPIYYLVNRSGEVIDSATGAGTVFGISCQDLTVRDLTFENNEYGVFLIASEKAVIKNVTATGNDNGFAIVNCNEIRLEECAGNENALFGFDVESSEEVQITGSEAERNLHPIDDGTGIRVEDCRDILIQDVNASQNNWLGIDLEDTSQAWLENVTVYANRPAGIVLGGDTIQVTGCSIRDNVGPGIGMLDSTTVSIWNNYFSNDLNVDLSVGNVTGSSWNTTKTAGTNIMDGPYLGGNYWASPDGTGFSQTHPDRGDGFCNASYILDAGNTDFLPLHLRTKPAFYADFTADPLSGSAPLLVAFTDASDGSPDSWSYSFGDGLSSTAKNPVHTYRTPGTYTVTLTVIKVESGGLVKSTTVKQDLITVGGGPGPGLAANFTAEPLSGSAPLSVAFTDTSTGSPDSWSYDFGDGLFSTAKNPVHIYRVPGTYSVALTVIKIEEGGLVRNTTVKQDLITVGGGPGPGLAANFTATPLGGPAPLPVFFTDTSTGSPDSWSYDFGDGLFSTAKNPVHIYRVPGTYTVTLTVIKVESGGLGKNTTVKQDLITVGGGPGPGPGLAANFTAMPLAGPAPLPVFFTDTSTGSPDSWSYDFGDGLFSTAKNPVHIYRVPGTYTVTLTVIKVESGGLGKNTTVKQDLITVG